VPDPQVVDNRCAVNDFLKRVVIDGKVINLSPKEYELFRFMFMHADRVLSTQEIIDHLWPDLQRASASDVHQYIHTLRRKVEADPNHPRCIVTVRGFGYQLVIPQAGDSAGQ
jgi:DNA-binding response OmpR family regulator